MEIDVKVLKERFLILFGEYSLEYAKFLEFESIDLKLKHSYQEAIKLNESSIQIVKNISGEGSIQIVRSYKRMANLYKKLNDK